MMILFFTGMNLVFIFVFQLFKNKNMFKRKKKIGYYIIPDGSIIDNRNFTHIVDVKFDEDSSDPKCVDYNTIRARVKMADKFGYKCIYCRLSSFTEERLVFDGYKVERAEPPTNNPNDTQWPLTYIVSWINIPKSKKFSRSYPYPPVVVEKKELRWREHSVNGSMVCGVLNKLTESGVNKEDIKIMGWNGINGNDFLLFRS